MTQSEKLSDLLRYEVGKPHLVNLLGQVSKHYEPCALFDPWRKEIHDLTIYEKRVSKGQVRSFNEDKVQFRLIDLDKVLVLLFRLGEAFKWDWIEYTYHLHYSEERSIPPTDVESAKLRTTLIDAGSGIVKAVRTHELSPEFTHCLHNTIAQQAQSPAVTWDEVHNMMMSKRLFIAESFRELTYVGFTSKSPATLLQP